MKLAPRPSLHLVGPFRAAAQHGPLSLHGDRQNLRVPLFEVARHASECSAGSGADHDRINPPLHLLVELAAGGLVMEVRIRLVFELSGHPRVWSLRGARLHQVNCAHYSFRFGRANDLST